VADYPSLDIEIKEWIKQCEGVCIVLNENIFEWVIQ
jgi:hypothetical protein